MATAYRAPEPHSPVPVPALVLFLTTTFLAVFAWSAWRPYDRPTWWMEVLPAITGFAIMAATYRRFPLTSVAYCLIWFYCLVMLTGGHYTYAMVPAGDWARDAFHLGRNHFDRLGHVMQGVVPAMVAREILLRKTRLERGGWLFYICLSIALAISAAYELIEWIAAVTSSEAADKFVGMQGDIWDAQKDMTMALVGAVVSQLALGRVQDRELGLRS